MIKLIDKNIELISFPDRSFILDILSKTASNCYQSEPKDKENLIKKVITNDHTSILEHVSFTFKITCDRATSHEWVRHRIGCSYAQESQRYCAYREDLEIVKPHWYNEEELNKDIDLEQIKKYDSWKRSLRISHDIYKDLLRFGMPPQDARGVLPNATATRLVVTMNLRALKWFIYLRATGKAHPDIRWFAFELEKLLYYRYPFLDTCYQINESCQNENTPII